MMWGVVSGRLLVVQWSRWQRIPSSFSQDYAIDAGL
jgi:hypothetical protein